MVGQPLADAFLGSVLSAQAAAGARGPDGLPASLDHQLAALAADLAVRCAAVRQLLAVGRAGDLAEAVRAHQATAQRAAHLQQASSALIAMLAAAQAQLGQPAGQKGGQQAAPAAGQENQAPARWR